MTEHIVTVRFDTPDQLTILASSMHADSIMRFLETDGVVLSAKSVDPVILTVFHRSGESITSSFVLAFEFTAISTMEEFSAILDRWKPGF